MTKSVMSPRTSIALRIAEMISRLLNADAIDVFFSIAMMTLPNGGITVRNACGMMMYLKVWPKFRPIARAASACPTGIVEIPERRTSATKQLV